MSLRGIITAMNQESKVLLIIGLITVLIIGGGIGLLGHSSSPSPTPSSTTPVNQQLLIRPDSFRTTLPIDQSVNPQTAATSSAQLTKVTIVEFGDFECPACAQAEPVVKQVMREYQGKVTYVFRNFPLPQHQYAMVAAEAAEAAGAQGKFWQMYDKLYSNQNQWVQNSKPMDYFSQYAQQIGLNTNQFTADVNGNKYQDKIQQDYSDAVALQISYTPTFYINGVQMNGTPTLQQFQTQINANLSTK